MNGLRLSLFLGIRKLFLLSFDFEKIFIIFQVTVVVYGGESNILVSFSTIVTTLLIICSKEYIATVLNYVAKTSVSFIAESQCSLKKFEGLSQPFNGTAGQKITIHLIALPTGKILKIIYKKLGYRRLNFLLSASIDSRESIFAFA
jgi:hypothetical protein